MKTIFFSLVLLFTLSCINNNDNNDFQPQTITPILIGKDRINGDEGIQEQKIVVSNQTTWTQLMNAMNATNNVTNNFSTTTIDFDNFQLLVVFDKIKTAQGHNINITNATENSNNIVVTVHTPTTPDFLPVMNQPFQIVKIPKSTKPVVFQ